MKNLIAALMIAVAAPALAVLPGTSSRIDYVANGVTVNYTFTFKALATADVEAWLNGVKQTSGFIVFLNANQDTTPGGNVHFEISGISYAPIAGTAIRIQRVTPKTQTTVLGPYSPFPAKTIEKTYDRTVMQVQEVDRRVADDEARMTTAEARITVVEAIGGSATAAAASAAAAQASAQWAGSTSVMRPPFNAACDGVTDDTTAIQAALTAANAANGGRVLIPASTVISSALTIYSNTWLELAPNATVIFKSGSTGNMLRNAAVTAQRSVSDAAITNGTTTLTSATAAFTSADVGRTVVVAGARGVGIPLVANITVFTNSTTVTISVAAQATVTGASCSIYTRDTNIRISGGTWDRGANGSGTFNNLNSLFFRHVDRLTFADVRVTSTAAKFAFGIGDATDVVAERLSFSTSSDGIHFTGPASKITVRDVRGATGDDSVAFTARDWTGFDDVVGDISDVLVDGVFSTSSTGLVKLLGGTSTTLRRITLRNIAGVTGSNAAIALVEDTTGVTDAGGVLIDGVTSSAPAGPVVVLRPTAGRDVVVRNVRVPTGHVANVVELYAWESVIVDGVVAAPATQKIVNIGTYTVGRLTISNVVRNSNAGLAEGEVVYLSAGGTITALQMANLNLTYADTTTGRVLGTYGTIGSFLIQDVSLTNGNCVVIQQSGSTTGKGAVVNAYVKGASRVANFFAAADVTFTNFTVDGPLNDHFFLDGSGAVILRGSSFTQLNTAHTGIELGGSWTGTLRIRNRDLTVSLPKTGLSASTAGDTFTNTNAGAAPGVGVVVSDGAEWIAENADGETSIGQSGGGSKTADASWTVSRYAVSDATAWTLNAPSACAVGRVFTVQIYNSSGGALGAITWTGFKFAGAAAPATPAAGRNTHVTFRCASGPVFWEISRSVDVTN